MLVLRFYFRWKSLIANLSRIVRVQEASEHNADRVVDSDILITLIIREKSRGCSSRESDRVFCWIKRRRVSSDLNFRKQQIHRIRPLIERGFAQKRRRYRELEKRKKKSERDGGKEARGRSMRHRPAGPRETSNTSKSISWRKVISLTSTAHWNPTLNFNPTCTKVGPFPSPPPPSSVPSRFDASRLRYIADIGLELQATVHFRNPHLPPFSLLSPSAYDVWTNVCVYTMCPGTGGTPRGILNKLAKLNIQIYISSTKYLNDKLI